MAKLINEKVDAVIVGSGAAGSVMAARLATGGKQVIVLEAGPERRNADLVSSTLWARRLKWHGDPVTESGDHPVAYVLNSGYGTGGAALHHYAVWPRLHPDDFRLRSRFDAGNDWPITYDDLRPHYDAVQAEAGISGDAKLEKWRPPGDPYPLPPVPVHAQGEMIARGFSQLGMATAPLPLAVTSKPYRNRPACIWDGWCDAGCPIGALANPLTVYLPIALAQGAQLRHNATVTRILTDPKGKRAIGVEYVDAAGERHEQLADLVVVAAFAVQTPRLLLASTSDSHPQGLGNARDLVGRGIMTHAAGLVYGLFDEDSKCYMGAFGGQLLNQDGYDKKRHADKAALGSYQWMIAQAVKPNDLLGISTTRPDLTGRALDEFMHKAARGFASMTAVIEDIAQPGNRVSLGDARDSRGVPLARVHHDADPRSRKLWEAVLDEGKRVFEAAGAREVWTGPHGGMHIMGGTPMGHSPEMSVTNVYGQLHDMPNVVIAGPGLFPSSGGVNPTFTVHALASRSAAHILANWRDAIA
ncbi:MAG: GMC family oxidoreductase [Steroidobacteraceae bacterium]